MEKVIAVPREPKDPREEAARALCRFNNVPEDAMFEGKPMWMSYLDEVNVVLEALRQVGAEHASQPNVDKV